MVSSQNELLPQLKGAKPEYLWRLRCKGSPSPYRGFHPEGRLRFRGSTSFTGFWPLFRYVSLRRRFLGIPQMLHKRKLLRCLTLSPGNSIMKCRAESYFALGLSASTAWLLRRTLIFENSRGIARQKHPSMTLGKMLAFLTGAQGSVRTLS